MLTPPPVIMNGSNYHEWKVKMEHYIKAELGIDAWISIRTGWNPDCKLEPMIHWSDRERSECQFNSKALNAIFCSVEPQQFNLIATCESAKEAWEKLEAKYVKTGKLQQMALDDVQSRFRNMSMDENESILAYYERVIDIAYEARTLGHVFDEEKLVRKIMKSISAIFLPVVSEIRERQNVTVGEFMGELRAYEKKVSKLSSLKM